MEEKIILLMEETGCDEGEARLALEISNNDFEKSIYTIKTIFRNIVVVKSKFYIEDSNFYGVFIFFLNKRSESLIKLLGVISYNPIVYETNLAADWNMVQKAIYNYRLLEGSIPALTQKIELHFYKGISSEKNELYKAIGILDIDRISQILIKDFPLKQPPIFQINIEEINLAQFQLLSDAEKLQAVNNLKKTGPKPINIESIIFEDYSGVKAKTLKPKDVVLVKINDNREIAIYLSKLLGTKDTEYIPVSIDEVQKTNNEIIVKLFFAQGVIGYVKLPANKKVRVIGKPETPFWKKLFKVKTGCYFL